MPKYTLNSEFDEFLIEGLDRSFLGDVTELFKVSYTGWITGIGGAEFLQVYNSNTKAKGDIAVFDGSGNWIRLPAGSDGTFLKADSTQPLGVRWASGGGGGGGSSLADSYLLGTVPADSKLSLINSLGGLILADNTVPITGPLFKVQANGGTGYFTVTKDDITLGKPTFGTNLGSAASPFTNLYLTNLLGATGLPVNVGSQLTTQNVVPDADGTRTLGTAGTRWSSVLTSGVSGDTGNLVLGVAANTNTVTVSSTFAEIEGILRPSTTTTYDLGTTGLGWRNLYVSSVLGNSGADLAVTANGTNQVVLGNGSIGTVLTVSNSAVTFYAPLLPDADLSRVIGANNKRVAQIWSPQISGGAAQTMRVTAGAGQTVEIGEAGNSDILTVASGSVTVDATTTPQADNTYDLGATGARWVNTYSLFVKSQSGDLGLMAGNAANVNIGPSNATTALVVGASTTTSANSIVPSATATKDLGASGTVWANIYGNLLQSAAGTNLAVKAGTTSSVVIGNGSVANVLSISNSGITQSVDQIPNADGTLNLGSGGARYLTTNSIGFVGGANGYIQLGDGGSVSVSGTGVGRIRYNNTTKKFQYSSDGGAFADFGAGGAGTFATIYSGTASDNVITESSGGGPLTIKDAASTIGSLFKAINNGNTISFMDLASSGTTITNSVVAGATPTPVFTLTGQAHTTATAGTEFFDVNVNLSRTVQFATGTLALQRAVVVQPPTYAFVGASTATLVATMAITGPPVAGTNATLGTDILTAVSSNLLLDRAGLAANSLPALHLRNNTAATSGTTVQKSPGILFEGTAWNTSASQPTKVLLVQEPVNAATVTTKLSLYTSINNAAASLWGSFGTNTSATYPKEMVVASQFKFRSTIADSTTAIAWTFDTTTAMASAGATSLQVLNAGNEVFQVGTSGAGGPQQYMRLKGGNGSRLAPAFCGNTASSANCGYEIDNGFNTWLITCETTTASTGRGNGGILLAMTLPSGNTDVGSGATTDPGMLWRFTKSVAANTLSRQVQLSNPTAATAANQRYSPFLGFVGQGWKTNATAGSQSVEFLMGTVPIQGAANPTGQFQFYSNINAAGNTQIGEITDRGSLRFNRIGGRGSAPGVTPGTGAGAGATGSVLNGGTDVSGVLEVNTAGTPTASAAVATVAFALAYDFAPHVILTPANDAAADLAGNAKPRVIFANTTTTQFVVTAGAGALTTGVTYRWHYIVGQATA